MEVTHTDLEQRYAAMSDDELGTVKIEKLTDTARAAFSAEMHRRGMAESEYEQLRDEQAQAAEVVHKRERARFFGEASLFFKIALAVIIGSAATALVNAEYISLSFKLTIVAIAVALCAVLSVLVKKRR